MQQSLTSLQRKNLRAQAHRLDPVVFIGKSGPTETVVQAADEALAAHELIKVRFVDRKAEKRSIIEELAKRTGAAVAGAIGHVAILFRQHEDPERRRIDPDARV